MAIQILNENATWVILYLHTEGDQGQRCELFLEAEAHQWCAIISKTYMEPFYNSNARLYLK